MIGAARNTPGFLSLLRAQVCDVALVDFSLSGNDMDGLNLVRFLRARFPDTKIVVFSAHDSAATIDLSMRAGASGFFPKTQPLSALVPAIRLVHRGQPYFPASGQGLPDGARKRPRETPSESAGLGDSPGVVDALGLSAREREVVRCCLEGLSLADTARKFSRSIKTVTNQRRAAFRKLGVRTVGELFKIHNQLEK